MSTHTVSRLPVTIRDAKRSEFQALARLQIRSWRDVYKGILPDSYLNDEIDEDLSRRWEALRPTGDDLVLVADRSGLLGFITVWCKPDPYIDNLHVEPEKRSGGVGELLMRSAASRLLQHGYDRVSLYVAARNDRAADFYRRLGGQFGEIERLHQKNGGDVDAIEVIWTDLAKLAGTT